MGIIADMAEDGSTLDLSQYNPDLVDGLNQIETEQDAMLNRLIVDPLSALSAIQSAIMRMDTKTQNTILRPLNLVVNGLNNIYQNVTNELQGRIATSQSGMLSSFSQPARAAYESLMPAPQITQPMPTTLPVAAQPTIEGTQRTGYTSQQPTTQGTTNVPQQIQTPQVQTLTSTMEGNNIGQSVGTIGTGPGQNQGSGTEVIGVLGTTRETPLGAIGQASQTQPIGFQSNQEQIPNITPIQTIIPVSATTQNPIGIPSPSDSLHIGVPANVQQQQQPGTTTPQTSPQLLPMRIDMGNLGVGNNAVGLDVPRLSGVDNQSGNQPGHITIEVTTPAPIVNVCCPTTTGEATPAGSGQQLTPTTPSGVSVKSDSALIKPTTKPSCDDLDKIQLEETFCHFETVEDVVDAVARIFALKDVDKDFLTWSVNRSIQANKTITIVEEG